MLFFLFSKLSTLEDPLSTFFSSFKTFIPTIFTLLLRH